MSFFFVICGKSATFAAKKENAASYKQDTFLKRKLQL